MRPLWLLDLDNTLHDAGLSILPRINQAMTQYMQEHLAIDEASATQLRVHYWRKYGATLLGLLHHHAIDPHDFLARTHPFPDMPSLVKRDAKLIHLLRRLPGRKVVFTNAPGDYASAVIRALGIGPHLDGVIAVEDMRRDVQWQPKPSRPMMRRVLARMRLPAARVVLVEDSPENLRGARQVGLRTVLVRGFGRQHHQRQQARGLWTRALHRGRSGYVDFQIQSVLTLVKCRIGRRPAA